MKNLISITIIIFVFFGCIQSGSNNNKGKMKEGHKVSNIEEKNTVSEYIKKRCDIDIVLETDENMDSLSDNLIYLFLYSFDESCSNNVEFSEYSNEVLFKLLKHYPDQAAKNIIRDEINQDVIFKELSSPINDAISVDEVVESLENSSIDVIIKKKFVTALKGN